MKNYTVIMLTCYCSLVFVGCKPPPVPTGSKSASLQSSNCLPASGAVKTSGTTGAAIGTTAQAGVRTSATGNSGTAQTQLANSAATAQTGTATKDQNSGEKSVDEFSVALTADPASPSTSEATDGTWKNQISVIVKDNCSTCHGTGKQAPEIIDYTTARKIALKVSTALVFNRHPKDKLGALEIDNLKVWATELVKAGVTQVADTVPAVPEAADKKVTPASTTPASTNAAAAVPADTGSELKTPASSANVTAASIPCQ